MICDSCGRTNPDSVAFCTSCGSELRRACIRCGFINVALSRFCGGCGGSLAEDQPELVSYELRQLTVLFCDLVGSTELSQHLDPEDLRDVLAAYHEVCSDAVRAEDGYIAQFLGDGVLVYFGYPSSHEDDALRAVRCGIDILARVEQLRSSGPDPISGMAVRAGAHTGRVLITPVGRGLHREQLALGDTPNVAARIQAEARPNTLLVSDPTWGMVAGYVRGEPISGRRLKGVSEPMRLWRVDGQTGLTERVEAARALTPFVGRAEQRAVLEEAWSNSLEGNSRFVILRGEPGVGKSRLVQTFKGELTPLPEYSLLIRARPTSRTSPFRPVIELLERGLDLGHDLEPDDRREQLERGIRTLGVTDPDAGTVLWELISTDAVGREPDAVPSPGRERARTMEVLLRLLEALAAEGPTLLVIEDLHWADASTLELLGNLIAKPIPGSLLAVFTARPDFDVEWCRSIEVVDLPPLPASETEAIVRGVASGKALPGDILRQIVSSSGGIPLFAEELTRSVLDSGALREHPSSWEAAAPVAAEVIPPSVEASLTARIDRLGSARLTALLAAAIGREFSVDLLGRGQPSRAGWGVFGPGPDAGGRSDLPARGPGRDVCVQARPAAGRGVQYAASLHPPGLSRADRGGAGGSPGFEGAATPRAAGLPPGRGGRF